MEAVTRGMAFPAIVLAALALSWQGVKGNRSYRAGEVEAAIRAYERALADRPHDPILHYNLGTALLRAGRTGEAELHLARALGGRAPDLRSRAFYNLGNVRLEAARAGEAEAAQRALDAYRQALLIRPDDEDAKWNLELALRELQRLRLAKEQAAGRDESSTGGQAPAQPPSPPSPPSPESRERTPAGESAAQPRQRPARDLQPLSREAAEQILNAAEEQERALRRQKVRRAPPSGRPAGPDW